MPVYEAGESDVGPFRAPGSGAKAQRVLPWWRRPAAIVGEVLAAVGTAALIGFLTFKPEPGIAFAARDWVVVGDLVNRTGQPLLDDSLDLAFRQGLSQSRYVNVLSTLQIRDALMRMKRDANATKVDRGIGAELAQREQARALLLPSVADTGGSFRLSVEVVDPATQATVWVGTENARQPEDLLPAMDRVIEGLREKLGESLPSIEADSVPLRQATTGNLEALRTYSIARKQYEQLKYDDARRLYERALEIDPEFAMAYAGIASTYLPLGRYAEGIPAAQRAAELRDRLSPRERAYIDALLAWAIDPVRGAERWRDYANLYPDLGTGQNNAGATLWQDLNRCAEAIPLFDQAFNSRDPSRYFTGHFKGYCELWMGQPRAAQASFEAALQVNPRQMTRGLADVYSYDEDFDAATAALDSDGQGVPPQFALEGDARRVSSLAYQGRLREARVAAQTFETAARAATLPATASRGRLYAAALGLQMGASEGLQAGGEQERAQLTEQESPQYPVSLHLAQLALIAQRVGQEALAREWAAAIREHPSQRPSPALQAVMSALDARLAESPEAAQRVLSAGAAGSEYFQYRVAAADIARLANDAALEMEQLQWIEAHRSRAFAEYSGFFSLQVLNVLDVNRGLLRQIELESDPERRRGLLEALRHRWEHADPEVRAMLPDQISTKIPMPELP
jgi:putative peptide modification system cyclase